MEKFNQNLDNTAENSIESIKPAKEIERKFVIDQLPDDFDFNKYSNKEITQGYLEINPDGSEKRLRQKKDKYFLTEKSGSGKTRIENEKEISKEEFENLWPDTEGKRVEKTRYEIPHDEGIIELDIYKGQLAGLISAEMEFKSEDESNKFTAPIWFGKEVTEDKRFKNQNLALKGIPENSSDKELVGKKILSYELKRGTGELAGLIKEKLSKSDKPIIVEIAGGSASGKTRKVTEEVKQEFGDEAIILSMDDYYNGKTFMDSEAAKGNNLNWDQPEALNLELLKTHLADLKQGISIEKPIYDMKNSESNGTETIHPAKIIIIEGLFALNDVIKNEGDIKAFVEIGTHGRIIRRLLRDIERTGGEPNDILKYFSEVVEPMHEKYVESTKQNAGIVINNEYSPAVEAERSGMHEVQMKFKAKIADSALRKIKADRCGSMHQIDKYYNPKDRNLIETGEILRIREESGTGKRILTYKGPKLECEFRKRAKFEFEIDKDTEEKFLGIYGVNIKTIAKERTLYHLDGIDFTIDKVKKIDNNQETDLGTYLEIRSNGNTDEDQIKKVMEKLGLDIKDGIKESYFEM